ncbi:MAG: hypothetical protein RL198_739 [Actinomycetota bacterium]
MIWDRVLDTLLPTNCVCCGRPPSLVCASCVTRAKPALAFRGEIQIAVASPLDQNLAKLITEFKDASQVALAAALTGLVNAALNLALQTLLQGQPTSALALTWVPSSRAAFRRRGFDANRVLLKRTQRMRQKAGLAPLRIVQPLRHVAAARDQSGLGRSARFDNLRGRFSARYCSQPLLIFDDIVTTGATLSAAASALESAGCTLLGGFAIAETQLRANRPGASRITKVG